jgi:crossover junction endodeoxyribonuclease RuvC
MDHVRAHEIIQAVQASVVCRPDLVVVEKPLQVAGQGDTSVRLGEIHGAIKHWLFAKGLTYVDVNLVHVKQYATGKGNAQKRDVLAAIIARYGQLLHVHTDHEADAVSLLAQALDAYGQPLASVPPNHAKAVHATKWPQLDLADGER